MKIKKWIWEIAKIIRGNDSIVIKPTTRCNLRCPYCCANVMHGRPARFTEVGVYDWYRLVIKQNPAAVTISGGEPSVYKDLSVLVNMLTIKGYVITIFSNLSDITEHMMIRPTWRVKFISTYHPGLSLEMYKHNLKILSKRFYIQVREVRPSDDLKPKYIKGAKVIELKPDQDQSRVEIYAPNMQKFFSRQDMDFNEEKCLKI